MCNVIKIRLKGRMREEVEKKTPKREMDLDVFYDVTHDTFRMSPKLEKLLLV